MAKPAQVITHVPALSARVKKIVTAYGGVTKAAAKLGDVVLEVAGTLKQADIAPFCAMVTKQLTEAGHPAGSVKTQVSYIRRVVTAVVVDGVEVEPGQSLRGIYDSLPKKETGGAAHSARGAKLPNPAKKTGDAAAPAAPAATLADRAEKVKAAVTMIFGYSEPDLIHALQYAAASQSNISAFIEWAKSGAQAGTMAELEAAVTAPVVKAPRKRKAAAAA